MGCYGMEVEDIEQVLGLFDIPDLDLADNVDDDSDIDESALESELEALLSGKAPARPNRPKPKVAPVVDIEKLAEACLKDDEDEEDDGNLSGDEDLLSELQNITADSPTEINEPPQNDERSEPPEPPKRRSSNSCTESNTGSSVFMLQERLAMYNEAVNAAKLIGDSSKIRRYGRAVKTLEGLIKSAKSGAVINEEDIPPVVKIPKIDTESTANSNIPVAGVNNSGPNVTPAAGLSNSASSNGTQHSAKAISNNSEEPQLLSSEALPTKSQLIARRDQYKVAAVQAKRSGNKDLALSYLRTVKTFDAVIEAMNNNLPVDLSNVPPPPPAMAIMTPKVSSERVIHDEVQTSSDMEKAALAAANDADEPEIFAAPPPPSSVLEALQQRLEKYTATKQAAEAENNSGKVRRLQRIIKQYETAIKDYKAGKNIDFEELPTPPGFAPIPVPSTKPSVIKPVGESAGKSPKEQNKTSNNLNKSPNQSNVNTNNPAVKKPKVQRTNTSTVGDKQLDYLLERQKLFRQAALTAKQNGDIQQAKEYLRMAKGFDSMIEATKCGLPIDATTIPTPPQLESSDFVIVDVSECTPNENCSQEELHENLEKDLRHQIEMCTRNKEHFLRLGDVSSASKFEKLCLESKKDLSVIQHLKKKGEPVPRFHYETRLFSMVQCHADLGDNDLEVTVERGINLPGKPDDLDSYVRLEFPIPQESPQRAKTHTVRDTNNPIFQEEFKFEFNRKSRSQLRQFKRQALKLEVWSKGGFLRSDTLLGTVSVKLADLESKCTVHDSFNLMDGRKSVGGKLEVKLRVRDPLLVKQVEEVREKWLVIGS
ncbi:coiled-coil and C2 domain-containing protein 1-like isoform X2 [Argiope bruennichi]|uniref:coiled-coil and C2 domain-containing protein 1-like isoform X2 n=1 Tax=Argiope bruennichi TaxID=94029 RepID=UPI0024951DDA|nr:coiled-coil and C2 domain-containing protein 1-like isoform X2 [Argiope bruennichi]